MTKEPHVCISCGRRDTFSKSMVCAVCTRRGDPYASSGEPDRDHRHIGNAAQTDRRQCAPGVPMDDNDLEAEDAL